MACVINKFIKKNLYKSHGYYLQCNSHNKLYELNMYEFSGKIYTKTGDKGKSSLYNLEIRKKNDYIFNALGNSDELNASIGICIEYCNIKNNIKYDINNSIYTTNDNISSNNINNTNMNNAGNIKDNNNNKMDKLNEIKNELIQIQCNLLDIGSHIATPKTSNKSKENKLNIVKFNSNLINILENNIDKYSNELPKLNNFILPSNGGLLSTNLHYTRTICRRFERSIVILLESDDIDENVFKYINRLSDYLFICARYTAMINGNNQTIYKKQS